MQGISVSLKNRFEHKWSKSQIGEGARSIKRKIHVAQESKKKSKKHKKTKWE